jgi:putative ABC transport system permease protein
MGASGGDRAVTTTRARTQQWMIGAEAALSMILLVSAMLLVRSLVREARVPPGFTTSKLLAVSIAAPAAPDRNTDTTTPFYADLRDRVRAVPGVDWVTATSNPPLGGTDGLWSVSPDPAVKLSVSSPSAQHDAVWNGYFEAMGIPLVGGRSFDVSDTADHPRVAVVNQTMARRLWPGVSPVGKQFLAPNGGVRTVIGAVADTRHRGLGVEPRPTFYETVQQLPTSRMTLLVHTTGDPVSLGPEVRAAVLAANRSALIERITTMDALVAASMKVQRFRMLLLQFFAVAALVVTVTGLGGVAAHSAAVRMRELSVRMAVGATPAMIRRLVLGQYAGAVALGTLAGAAGAAAMLRVAAGQVFGVTWHDPASYVSAAALIVTGSWIVGWRSLARLDKTNLSDELAAR